MPVWKCCAAAAVQPSQCPLQAVQPCSFPVLPSLAVSVPVQDLYGEWVDQGSTWLAALQGQQEAEGKSRQAAAPAKLPRPQADTMLSPEQLQLIIDHFEKVGSQEGLSSREMNVLRRSHG